MQAAALPDIGGIKLVSFSSGQQVFVLATVFTLQVDDLDLSVRLACELRPYQREGIAWLAFLRRTGLHGCLADDMGLGKTLQATAIIAGQTCLHLCWYTSDCCWSCTSHVQSTECLQTHACNDCRVARVTSIMDRMLSGRAAAPACMLHLFLPWYMFR